MLRRASPIADASDKVFESAWGAASSYGLELARKLAFDGADSVLIWAVGPVPQGGTGQAAPSRPAMAGEGRPYSRIGTLPNRDWVSLPPEL